MHLPVLALVSSSKRRFCRTMRVIPVFVRVVFDHEPDLAFVGIHDLFDDRTGRHTVRSLKVDELYDRYRSVSGPFLGGIADSNVNPLFFGKDRGADDKKRE